ncbi:MAG: DUF3106 domain-containing protein [Pseudomonadota bacterium]
MMKLLLILIALSAELALAADWESLSEAEQRVLVPFAEDWDQLSEEQQEKLISGARMWTQMSPEQQRLAHQRYVQWQRYSSEQQDRILERYERFRDLPPARQRLLRQNFARFKALPEERRAQIRERWNNMSAAERQAFLDGIRAADAGRNATTDRVLSRMSPAQARWFRQTAAELTPAARRRLTRMLVTGNPQRWNELERRLAAMTLEERESFLTR